MAKYRIQPLADLARQMGFAPRHTRLAQLQLAEKFLYDVEPNKAYPLELVIHKVTGYRPKRYDEDLYPGLALQHDLGLLIEEVSETLDLHSAESSEPVLLIDDVTARFNVTSKTIQRWRRRGLPARRFLFPDGKRRVGFLLSSVERFFSEHQDQVDRGMDFSQVDESEVQAMVRRARRMAVCSRCSLDEICRRVAKAMNRSPLTILHTLRKHDQEQAADAILPLAAEPVTDEQRSQILRAYRRGMSLSGLARRFDQPRLAVYRIILGERINQLDRRKVKFIDDPLYHQEEAERQLEAIVQAARQAIGGNQSAEETRVPRDLPAYLQELYRTPLLTPALERALFLQLHYYKFQFVAARRRLEPQFARLRDVNALEMAWRKVIEVKNQIVRANLRLVVSNARKHLRPSLNLMELVSEGNLTLLRAVESFDVHKGNRFSTYATLALMKGFARSVPQMLNGRAAGDPERLAEVPDADSRINVADRFAAREEVGRLLDGLTDHEQRVVRWQFGIGDSEEAPADLTAQQLRQVERTALAKLRYIAKPLGK